MKDNFIEIHGVILWLLFISLGVFLSWGVIMGLVIGSEGLDQETTDEICQKLAFYEGNYTNETIEQITSQVKKGELICITPSFDHTQKIKFKSNVE